MKRSFIGILALGSLLACQSPSFNPATGSPSGQARLNRQSEQNLIARYYPIAPGHSWTFQLQQSQNGQDNTKFKTMNMFTEALPPEAGAERAVMRRSYPDSTVTPTPSLAKRFSDRVELSRYQAPAQASTQVSAPTGLETLSLQPPAGAQLPAVRGVNFISAMQLPLNPGNHWEGRIFQGGTETISVKGFESISVPAGKFETLVVEHHLRYDNGKEDYLRYWYAPNIGMVKLHEELTTYFGQWLKLQSDGLLVKYTTPASR